MALSNQQDLNVLLAYILQESWEKAEEIDVRANEAFKLRRQQIVLAECDTIDRHYQREEKKVSRQSEIAHKRARCEMKLRTLRAQDDIVYALRADIKECLAAAILDRTFYARLLNTLILEGLYKMLEEHVIVRCLSRDVQLISGMKQKIFKQYQAFTGRTLSLVIDNKTFLGDDLLGGVQIFNRNRRIVVRNTLDVRLNSLYAVCMPFVKFTLFGPSPHQN